MSTYADADILTIAYAEDAIQRRVAELGAEIARDYAGMRPVLVSVLKGSAPLVADLLRSIDLPIELELIAVSSYAGPSSTGVVRLLKDVDRSLERRHVLLMEDVVDTGLTLSYVLRILRTRRPASIVVGTLLDKPAHRLADIDLCYRGFVAPPAFYVGYGLDFRQRYRNLPYIGVLRSEIAGV